MGENMENDEVKKAFETIKQAMIEDNPSEAGSLAHAWHCNIAMACFDAFQKVGIGEDKCVADLHETCNDGATRFMKMVFDVDTKQ
jgi:hypothetical protein